MTWMKLIEEEGMKVGQSREEDMEEADRGRRYEGWSEYEEDMEESDIGRKHEGWSEQGRRHGRS